VSEFVATETKLDLARAFRALGDPNRLAIYQLIRRSEPEDAGQSAEELRNSVSEIAARFDISLSTVSHHLKELRTAGLITCERRGQHIFCSVNSDVLADIEQFVKSQS
jgi:DNA-binding transcriptional ArsR family regulator